MQELDHAIAVIISHSYFQQLKHVKENILGFHNHESVYDHCVKTSQIALEQREGNFITNPEAKILFTTWMNEKIVGIQRKDILVLVALLHDCGKILSYTEGRKQYPINKQFPNGQTTCPGHEFWGGEIVVPVILQDISLPEIVKKYIADSIKIHGFANTYALEQKTQEIHNIVEQSKSQMQGLYKEGLFNSYCDCYTAPGFLEGKKLIEGLFNQTEFYYKREYKVLKNEL